MSWRRVSAGLIGLATAAAVAFTVAACGGDAKPDPAGSPRNPLVAKTQEPVGGRSNGAQAARRAVSGGVTRSTEQPGYQQLLERQSSRPQSRFSPCNLVPPARARAILGKAIQPPVEAPQGPTCIYRTRSGGGFTTLAVQAVPLATLKRQMRHPRRIEVSGRKAYCSTRVSPGVYVPLSGGRVLSVAARCAVARQFAASAVRRLTR